MPDKYPFTFWNSLAAYASQISLPGGTLFFYDCKPSVSEEADKNSPALVFIHGLADEADTWRHLLPIFCAKGYRCLAPDLPGFGRSLWRGRISVSRHAQAVIQMIESSGIGCPVALIGSSMGCGVAELIAFKRPDLVKSLILVDGCFPVHRSLSKGFLLLGLPFAGRLWYRGFRKNHEGAWKTLYAYYSDLDAMSDEDKTFLRNRVIARVESDNQERGYFACLRNIGAAFIFAYSSFSCNIKKFSGKISLVWGEHDRVVPLEKISPFRGLRPDAELKIIAGAGHLPQQENPKETAEAILSFLN